MRGRRRGRAVRRGGRSRAPPGGGSSVRETAHLGQLTADRSSLGANTLADGVLDAARQRRLELRGKLGESLDLGARALERRVDVAWCGAPFGGLLRAVAVPVPSLLRPWAGTLAFGRRMKRSELEYSLPEELIAQHPAERRDESRLLVYERQSGDVRHRRFRELPEELRGELVVVNDTRVVPARLRLERPGGGDAEVLLLEPLNGAGEWEGLARPTKKLRPGQRLGAVELARAPGRGALAPAARGRTGRRGAASAVHHRAARRPRALPDGLRGARGLGRRADRRPPLHARAPASSSTSSASRSTSASTRSGR